MPACIECGSQHFDALDSLYFCQECGTQSQDFRDEKCDEGQAYSATPRLEVRQKVGDKKGKEKDKGKPWISYEAFQILLKAQVNALIDMGFNPKLKDIVGQLWFTYLRKSNIAFTGSQNTKEIDKKATLKYARDINLQGKDEKATGLIVMHRLNIKRKLDEKGTEDELELSSDLSSADNDTSDINMDDKIDSDSDEESFIKYKTSSVKARASRYHMGLRSTLFLCYFGLQWLMEPVGLGDLIRWANAGCLPYYDAAQFLPPYMKLSDRDCVSFTSLDLLELSKNLWHCCSCLFYLLELPLFPIVDVTLFTCRYIIDLNLPDCVHRVVWNLIEKTKLKSTQPVPVKGFMHVEEVAMSYIIIALKLLYGLDDKRERELNKMAEPLMQDDTNSSSYMYIWEDWVTFIKQWQSEVLESGLVRHRTDLEHLRDAKNYGKHCFHEIFGRWIVPTSTKERNWIRRKSFSSGKNTEYAQVFSDLTKKSDSVVEAEEVEARTFTSPPKWSERLSQCIIKMKSRGILLSKLGDITGSTNSNIDSSYHQILHLNVPFGELPSKIINLDDLPESYVFALVTCAKLIECNPRWLAWKVWDLEEMLFVHGD